jgi:hypothetical protein
MAGQKKKNNAKSGSGKKPIKETLLTKELEAQRLDLIQKIAYMVLMIKEKKESEESGLGVSTATETGSTTTAVPIFERLPLGLKDELKKETTTKKTKAFSSQVYDEIDSKIGGNGYNQFLCLLIPGIILRAEDFSYDVNKEIKGPVIEANECQLANKMFDPCTMTNSDNGRNLAYQYKMALDMLTPKVNKRLALHKNKLRKLLISPYPYDFGDGVENGYTLQEVYFRLYEEYTNEIYKWKKLLTETKMALREQYPLKEDYENAFMEWYEDNAEDYLDEINEKKSKVLAVFSPNDMKILEGILDSGSGAELQEARQTLYNYRKLTPTGGYIYPVSFEPKNWFEMIGTSFTSAELMDSPEKIIEKLQRLSLRRIFLYSGIYDICKTIGNDLGSTKLKPLMSSVLKYKTEVEHLTLKTFDAKLTPKVVIPILEIRSKSKIQLTDRMLDKLITSFPSVVEAGSKAEKDIKSIYKDLNSVSRNYLDAHDMYLEQSYELTTLLIRLVEEKEAKETKKSSYPALIKPLKNEIDALNEEISYLHQQLIISTAIHDNMDEDILQNDIVSPSTPKGFTKVEFETDAASLDVKTDYTTSASMISSGSMFLFNGNRSRKLSAAESKISSSLLNKKCTVQVSMNVAKIGINRDWFNPGIFSLTGDMFRLSETLISPSSDITAAGFNDKRFLEMQNKIFPCYPVSMVLARNMQIKFKYQETLDEKTRETFEKHAKSNGGFLLFRGRDEHGNSDLEGVHTSFTDETVTLTFDTTQVIGYYLQATAPDKSTFLDGAISEDDKKVYSTVADFGENYRLLIDAAVKKRIPTEADTKDIP